MLPILLALAIAKPVALTDFQKANIARDIVRHREEEQRWLKTATSSYLATIGRTDFGSRKTLTVGTGGNDDVKLPPDEGVPAGALTVTVIGDEFQVTANGTTFRYQNANVRATRMPPGSIELGRFRLILSHQKFPAVIVQDPDSPRFANYKGLQFFPVDFKYRFVLPLVPNPHPEDDVILSTRGNRRHARRVGWFDFEIDGHRCRLEAHRLLEPGVGENDLIVLFRDRTTGHETYPVGRYVDPEKLPDGQYVLDFNEAYNPACAYSPDYNCPLPPRANTLPVAIRAGEMDAHYPH